MENTPDTTRDAQLPWDDETEPPLRAAQHETRAATGGRRGWSQWLAVLGTPLAAESALRPRPGRFAR